VDLAFHTILVAVAVQVVIVHLLAHLEEIHLLKIFFQ
jgi:hypothetical protein